MKDFNKNKELSYLKYRDVNNLCCWKMLQKLRANNFDGLKILLNVIRFHKKL